MKINEGQKIEIQHELQSTNIPKKEQKFHKCPLCLQLRTHEYKYTRRYECGSSMRYNQYTKEFVIIQSRQCEIIQKLKEESLNRCKREMK